MEVKQMESAHPAQTRHLKWARLASTAAEVCLSTRYSKFHDVVIWQSADIVASKMTSHRFAWCRSDCQLRSSCIRAWAHANQVSNYKGACQTWRICASLKHTQSHTPRHHLQSKGNHRRGCWVLTPRRGKNIHTHTHIHTHINNQALLHF